MVEKSKTEPVNKAENNSSEELFLYGSDNDEILRKKAEEDHLKLDDVQEELSLQNILRGSEQRETMLKSTEQKGAGAQHDSSTDIKSESKEFATRDAIVKNTNDEEGNILFSPASATLDEANNARDTNGSQNDNQDSRRVLSDFENDNNDIDQGQLLFDSADQGSAAVDNNELTVSTAEPDDSSHDSIESHVNVAPEAGDNIEQNVDEGVSIISGQVIATDANPGDVLSYQTADGFNIPDGFLFSNDGSWQFNAQHETYDHLNAGDSVVITVPVVVADDFGASDTTQIQIIITGTNDAPVAGENIALSVNEGNKGIAGQFTSTDVDAGSTASFTIDDGVVSPAGFVLKADGSYSFDPTDSAYDHLNAGDSVVLTVSVTVTDDHGATDSTQIQITVTGTNDAPVAGAHVIASVVEDDAIINGQLTSSDLDDGSTASYSVTEGSSAPDGFILNTDGSYSFDPTDAAYDYLNAGDSQLLTIPVTVKDDQGAADTSQIQITVTGTNDVPLISSTIVIQQIEENLEGFTGYGETWSGDIYSVISQEDMLQHLNISDADSNDFTVTLANTDDGSNWHGGLAATDSTFSNSTSNNYDETVVQVTQEFKDNYPQVDAEVGDFYFDNVEFDQLNDGDIANISFTVQVSDGDSVSEPQTLNIEVVGSNDAPIIGAEIISAAEGAAVISGQLSSSDVDAGSTATFSVSEGVTIPDDFVLNTDGSYTFDPADTAYEHLSTGDSELLTIPVTVTDEHGATDVSQIQITVTGTNTVPTATDDITEGFSPENASLVTELSFEDGIPNVLLGSVTAEGDGQVGSAADFNHAKVEVSGLALNSEAGAQTTVSMWIQANPEGSWEMLAASDRYDMVILNGDIGFNTAGGDMFGTDASELADGEWHHIVGVFTNGDVSQNTIHIDGIEQEMSQIQGTPNNNVANIDSNGGSLFFGSWGANNNYLFSGSMDEVKVFDGALSSSEITSLYDIEANNSIWNGGALSTHEDSILIISPAELLANDTDPDGDILSISSVQDGEHGSVEIDGDGNILFTPDENYNGEATFSYTVSDGNGGENTATVTLNVSTVNDLPSIDVVSTISVDEDGSQQFVYSTSDIDSSNVVLTGSANNGTVIVNDNGTVTFTPDENYFGDDTIVLTATDSNGGVTTEDISVTVNPVEDAPDAVDDGAFEPQSATLTAEINFDDGVPTAVLGSVTTESDGQLSDAADFASAKVEISELALNGDAGAQTTVSMWIQANPEGSWEMLAASDRYDMVILNGDIGFNTAGGDMFGTDASELADGEWHHIVGVFTNGDVSQNTIHIDGIEQEMSQIQGTPNNNVANIDSNGGSLFFGSWGANNNYLFSGSMDEVKVFDGALSSGEISTLYDIESSNIKWDGTSLLTDEDVSLVIDPSSLLTNDIDVDGDVLSIVSVQDAENGTVEIDGNGNVVFTPDANYNGEATFTYTIDDGNGNTDTATATLNVESVNDAPTDITLVGGSVDENANIETALTVNDDGASNEYAAISDFNDFPTTEITLEMQFSSDAADVSNTSFASYATNGSNNEFLLFSNGSGDLNVYINGSAHNTGVSASDLIDGESHQLSVTWNSQSGELNVYVDGNAEYSGTHQQGHPIETGGTLVFGQEQDNVGGGFDASQVFEGTISDVRIFDEVRTPQQIADNANSELSDPSAESGLVSYYNFNSVTDNEVTDLAGNNTLTIHNGASVGEVISVDENASTGTVVATLSTVDEDTNDSHSYILTDDSSGYFEIVGNEILVKADANIDFETNTSHAITIEVTDEAGSSYAETVIVNVNDLNDAPTDIVVYGFDGTGEGALIVNNDGASNEYAAISDFNDFPTTKITLEMQFSSDAADASNTSFASYATDGSHNEFLLFSNGSGDLNVYINGSAHNTGVSASDLIDGESHQLSVTWNSQSGELNVYVDGNAEYSGTHQQGHPIESGGTLMFGQEQDNVGGGFDANQVFEGTISDVRVFDEVRTPQQIADNANSELSDPGAQSGLVSYYNFNSVNGNEVTDLASNNTLTIHNGASIDSAFNADTAATVDENAAAGTVVATLSTVDADTGDSHSYAITDDASGFFEITGNEIRVNANADIDFESAENHDITVQVTDSAGNQYSEQLTINVNDDISEPVIYHVGDGSRYHNITSDLSNEDLAGYTHVVGDASNDTIIGNEAVTNYDGGSGHDHITGSSGDDMIQGGAGNDILSGGTGNDTVAGGEGHDTYVMNPFDGSDYFSGGEGGGWTDAIDISAIIASDPDSPWTLEVDGVQQEYDIAASALELNPDTAGVISFGDGSELSFEGVERIEW